MSISAILVMAVFFTLVISLTFFSLYKTVKSDLSSKSEDDES